MLTAINNNPFTLRWGGCVFFFDLVLAADILLHLIKLKTMEQIYTRLNI